MMVNWKHLSEVSSNIFAGGTPDTKREDYYDGNIPWLRSGEIDFNVINKAERNITQLGFDNSSARWIKSNSVLMAMTGATVAKSAILEIESTANQSVCAIEPSNELNYKFLYYYLSSKYISIRGMAQGALTSLNLQLIKKIKIPVPKLSIQESIVSQLDSFTFLISKLEEELEERKKQYEYYRDKIMDLEGSYGVEKVKLDRVCSIYDGTHQTPRYTDNGVRFVSVENIKDLYSSEKYISWEDYNSNYKTKPQQGDILMTRIGDVGTCAVINRDEPIAYYVSLSLLRPKYEIIQSKYLKYAIESRAGQLELRKRTLLTAVPLKINLGDIGKINILVPQLSMQVEIVNKLDAFTNLISKLEEERDLRQKQYEYYREKLLTFE